MAEKEHLAILKQGMDSWNTRRKGNPDIRPDLHGALLMETQLAGVYLHNADLAKANLAKANLAEADLARALLAGASTLGADLT